jgi:ribonuclease R
MKQAKYQDENLGHFGLAAKYYCHFTSPIRRYPDLQIHRIIKESIDGLLNEKKIKKYGRTLGEVAAHCSVMERVADDAERETDKLKMAEYMEDHIGEEYDGIVSGVTGWGIYVELPNTVEGMAALNEISDDFYNYDEDNLRVVGKHTGKIYMLGDSVRVKVVRADAELRTIDFALVNKDEENKD